MKMSIGKKIAATACGMLACCAIVAGGIAYATTWQPAQLWGASASQANAPQASVWDGTANTSWYNTTAKSFTLSTPQQLAGLAQIASGTAEGIARDTFEGKTITLAADLQLNSASDPTAHAWTPIADVNTGGMSGSTEICFDGTFDGDGHKVEYIYINGLASQSAGEDYGGYQGLFGALGSHAVVENVGIESGSISGRVVGGIAAISQVTSADEVPQIIACYNKASITGNGSTSRGTGGIFGGEDQFGAEQGAGAAPYRGAVFVSSCYNRGTITSSGPVGGIAGTGSLQIHGCYNTGDVTSSTGGSAVGALAANMFTNTTVNGFSAKSTIDYSVALSGSSVTLLRFLPERSIDKVVEPSTNYGDPGYVNNVGFTGANGIKKNNTMSDSTPMLPPATVYIYDSSNTANDGYPLLWWQVSGKSRVDISTASVSVDSSSVYYTGGAREPEVTVETTPPEATDSDYLIEGVDYRVSYRDNVAIGTAYVDVCGIGRYQGQHDAVSFQIVQIDLSKCSIKAIDPQWGYGQACEPEITILDANGDETDLEAGYEYTVTYQDNDRDGTATVTATGNGKATRGQCSATFQVTMAAGSFAGGTGTEADPYQVSTKGQLQYLAHLVNTNAKDETNGGYFATKSYKVTQDIDAAGSDTTRAVDAIGIGSHNGSANNFAGSFDGGGHTITVALSVSSLSPELDFWAGNAALGFFGRTANGGTTTIKNLTLAGSVTGQYMAGGFIGNADDGKTVIENCTNKATVSTKSGTMPNVGGFIAYATSNELQMTGCVNAGQVSGTYAGGLVSQDRVAKTSSYKRCRNEVRVLASECSGGLVAYYHPSVKKSFSFENCANTGEVRTMSSNGIAAGGILGLFQGTEGTQYKTGVFTSCYNSGKVWGCRHPGGIMGTDYCMPLDVASCYNAGSIEEDSKLFGAGGIVGALSYEGTAGTKFSSCYNVGDLKGTQTGGGMIGHCYAGAQAAIDNCFVLSGKGNATGFGTVNQAVGAQKPVVLTGQASALSEADMKGADMPGRLGDSFVADYAEASEQLNGGYPLCYWQKGSGESETRDLSKADVSAASECEYTGSPIEPDLTVSYEGSTLKKGIDFFVSYKDNVKLGTASAILMGRGVYTGSKTFEFKIVQGDLAHATIAEIPAQWAADKATPELQVTNSAGNALVAGTDYTASYVNNGKTGTAGVTITGTGNYTGTNKATFAVKMTANKFYAGSGTAKDPYQIGNKEQFYLAACKVNAGAEGYVDAHYRLVGDLDLTQQEGEPAELVCGVKGHPFKGTFDGNGRTVTLGIAKVAQPYQGLFGVTQDATIKDLVTAGSVSQSVPDPASSGDEKLGSAGALVGYALDGLTVEGCTNRATVSSNGSAVAGLVGIVDAVDHEAVLSSCANEGAVSSDEICAGGLVGDARAEKLVVRACSNTASVTAARAAAGLVGRVGGDSSERTALDLETSFNTGAVTGANSSAGLAGAVLSYVDAMVRDCFNRGQIACTDEIPMLYQYTMTNANGGLLGTVGSQSRVSIDGAYNAGALTKDNDNVLSVGGLVGALGASTAGADIAHAVYADSAAQSIGKQQMAADALSDSSQAKTDAELKSEATAQLLGDGLGYDRYTSNGGYPVIGSLRQPLSGCTIGTIADQRYTGAPVVPQVEVTDGEHSYTLQQGVDFKVVCTDNVKRGTATAQVVGIGTYRGEGPKASFAIKAGDISSDCTIESLEQQLLVDGKAEPVPTVTNKVSGVQLEAGVDFDLSYANNTSYGATATVTVTGKGNYTGSLSAEFKVAAADAVSMQEVEVAPIEDQAWTGQAVEPVPVVSYRGKQLRDGEDYVVSYRDNVEVGMATVVLRGRGSYAGTREVTFKILEMNDLSNARIDDIADQKFTGKAVEPELAVRLGGKLLSARTDYDVKYSSNVKAGTAYATVSGKGDYKGSKTVSFKIYCDMADAELGEIPAQVYSGAAIEPAVEVSFGGKTLKEGSDYELSYADNVDAGTATATVTGKGDYAGSASTTFRIDKLDLNRAEMEDLGDIAYTGEAVSVSPVFTVGGVRIAAENYGLSYLDGSRQAIEAPSAPGTYLLEISGKGNCTGSLTVAFRIVAGDISQAQIGAIPDQTYTGQPIAPQPEVTLNGRTLALGTDYRLSYSGNVEVGTATVYVTGMGSYEGFATARFAIVAAGAKGDGGTTEGNADAGAGAQTDKDGGAAQGGGAAQDGGAAQGGNSGNADAGAGKGVKVGAVASAGKLSYRVTKAGSKTRTVAIAGSAKGTAKAKLKKLVVPSTVKIGGKSYKVTSIAPRAFKGAKALKSVTVRATVVSVGKDAFRACGKLKSFTCKSKKLTSIGAGAFKGCKRLAKVRLASGKVKKVGSKAFSKTPKKLKVYAPKGKLKDYRKLFVKKGLSKRATFAKL